MLALPLRYETVFLERPYVSIQQYGRLGKKHQTHASQNADNYMYHFIELCHILPEIFIL